MVGSTSKSSLYHVYKKSYKSVFDLVFNLDFQGHVIKLYDIPFHDFWIPRTQKHGEN